MSVLCPRVRRWQVNHYRGGTAHELEASSPSDSAGESLGRGEGACNYHGSLPRLNSTPPDHSRRALPQKKKKKSNKRDGDGGLEFVTVPAGAAAAFYQGLADSRPTRCLSD